MERLADFTSKESAGWNNPIQLTHSFALMEVACNHDLATGMTRKRSKTSNFDGN